MILLRDHPLLHRYLHVRYAHFKASRFEVSLPWADEVELVGVIDVDGQRYFLGGEALGSQRAKPDDYRGLSVEECLAIQYYRAFRLFQPWPQPIITIAITESGHGHVMQTDNPVVPVQMMQIGSSQAWWGGHVGVIWEVLLDRAAFSDPATYRTCYMAFWRQIEDHLRGHGIRSFVTEHADPAFDTDWYQDVLRSLGYQQIQGGAFRKDLS